MTSHCNELNTALPDEFQRCVTAARDAICRHRLLQPEVAIILGSGLGPLAQQVQHRTTVPYGAIPYFPCPSADGHSGELILGFLAGIAVVLMSGRTHRYEGRSSVELEFPVHCLHALGARSLIVTNAAGGLNPHFRSGELMVLESHIDWLWPRGQWSRYRDRQPVSARRQSPYSGTMIERALSIARRNNIILHQGCYLATLGPTYETRSEYRMFRWMGADAVGMSTIPEVLSAQALKMPVLAFSVITNVASPDIPVSTTHGEVVETGHQAGPKLMTIVRELLEDQAGQPD